MGALIFPFLTLILDRKIGLSSDEIGSIIGISGLLYVPASLIGGYLSDRIGRKKILVAFDCLGIIGYICCYFTETSMTLVYMLMASSFLFAVAGPSHDAITADLTGGRQREGAYSLNYFGFNIGYAFSQIIGGYLFEKHFKTMFIIDAVTALFGMALIILFVKETHRPKAAEEEIVKENPEGLSESEAHTDGSILRILFERPILIYYAIASFGYKFVYSQWGFLIPLHVSRNFGEESGSLFGSLGFTNAAVVVLFTLILTSVFSKKSNIKKVFYAGILFTIGFGMLGFFDTKPAFFIAVFIFTLGEILEATSSMPFIMSHTPASHRGRMSSVVPIIMGVGYVIGPSKMGSIAKNNSYEFCWKVIGGIALLATLLMKILDRYDQKHFPSNIGKVL
jgi:MFS family permease